MPETNWTNEEITRRFHLELLGEKKLQLIDKLIDKDFVLNSPYFATIKGKDALAGTIEYLHKTLAGITYTIDEMILAGEKVVVRYTARGMHMGPFLGVAPTNKHLTVPGMSVLTFKNGKIVSLENQWNALGMMEQIGGYMPEADKLKSTAVRFTEEFLNQRRYELADELFTEDFKFAAAHVPELQGKEAMKEWSKSLITSFPDYKYQTTDMVAERNEVVHKWGFAGTHKGLWMGVEPTGKKVALEGVTIFKFREGKISELWAEWDALAALQKLGVAAADETMARKP